MVNNRWNVGPTVRYDGPSPEYIYKNSKMESVTYFDDDGYYHYDKGPAYQYWNDEGILAVEIWCKDGYNHRTNGPAYIRWNEKEYEEEWHFKGEEITTEVFYLIDSLGLSQDWKSWTEVEKEMFQLHLISKFT